MYLYLTASRAQREMAFLFGGAGDNSGRPKSQATKVSEQRAQLRSGVRALAREEGKSAKEEQTLITDIKRLAKCGDIQRCTAKAKELVRVRAHTARIRTTQSQFTAMSRQLGMLVHTVSTGDNMAKLTLFLRDMNKNMDIKSMHNMFKEFEMQQCRLGETSAMMEDNMDSEFEAENETECTDDALSSIFAELGVDIKHQMQASPASNGFAPMADTSELDLEDRLRRLRVPT